jgi:hypothetical protein
MLKNVFIEDFSPVVAIPKALDEKAKGSPPP